VRSMAEVIQRDQAHESRKTQLEYANLNNCVDKAI
jgi:hypothetical protein